LDATPLNSPGVWKFKVRSRTALQSLPRHGERSGTGVGPLAGSRSDPQSLTRYVYVMNDPVSLADPLGLLHDCAFYRWVRYRDIGLERDGEFLEGYFCGGPLPRPIADDGGLRYGPSGPQPAQPLQESPKPPQVRCIGPAHIIRGNPNHVGREGAFPGTRITRASAVIIPQQFGTDTAGIRPYIEQISGTVTYFLPASEGRPAKIRQFKFTSVADVIGPPSVRREIMMITPPQFGIELPGLPHNFRGEGNVELLVSAALGCPSGTRQMSQQQ